MQLYGKGVVCSRLQQTNYILLALASRWGWLAALLGCPHLDHPSMSPVSIRSHKPPGGKRDWAHGLLGYWDSHPQEQSENCIPIWGRRGGQMTQNLLQVGQQHKTHMSEQRVLSAL